MVQQDQTVAQFSRRFNELWSSVFAQGDPQPILSGLLEAYQAPDRGHHNARHVVECLESVDAHYAKIAQVDAMRLAFFWHDVVYDASSKRNELDSTIRAISELSAAKVSAAILSYTEEFILSFEQGLPIVSDDAKLFRDIDYWIIGSPPKRYAEYAAGIRKEYQPHCTPAQYRAGRQRFLLSTLGQDRLFLTDSFQDEFFDQAQENIHWELDALNDEEDQ